MKKFASLAMAKCPRLSIRFTWPPVAYGQLSPARRPPFRFGARLRFLATQLEACTENSMAAMARLADEDRHLLAHMGRSGAGFREVSQIITEPDRDRRNGVVDEQGRSYQPRRPRAGNARNTRTNKEAPGTIPRAMPRRKSAPGKIGSRGLAHMGGRLLASNPQIRSKLAIFFFGARSRRVFDYISSSVVRWMYFTEVLIVECLLPSSPHKVICAADA